MKKLSYAVMVFLMSEALNADIPSMNYKCFGNIDMHADEGGPVYINGKEAKLKKINDNYFDASGSGVVLSVGINPDGTTSVMYTGKHGANGVCQEIKYDFSSSDKNIGSSRSTSAISFDKMATHCRGEAAGMYNTKPMYIHTSKPMSTKHGYIIKGYGDLGIQGNKSFQCIFNNNGNFVRWESLVDEGRL